MQEATHTPGPWIAKANPNDWGWDFPNVQDTANCRPICHVPDWDKPEGEANWALIAAAPELLEALQRLQRECTEEWPLELVDQVDAAITKAGGVSA